jgi:chromosome partitioning protein
VTMPAATSRWYRYWAARSDQDGGAEPQEFHVEPGTAGATTGASAFHVERDPTERRSAALSAAVGARRFPRAHVLTVANQKGGVGKTTTAVSLSAALADMGCRVLLVDLDPQANATSGVGLRVRSGQPTIYDVLVNDLDVDDVIEPSSVRNLFVIPSHIDLAGAEVELVSAFSREQKLRRALEPVREEYDLIIVDCPPSLGLLTVNALTAGDGVIVPIQCEYYALEGLGALNRNAELIQAQLNPDLVITGFVMTMLDARTRLSQQVIDEVSAHFGELVFRTRIPRSVRLAEAPSFGQPITVFDPSSRGAMAYRRLAAELLERLDPDEEISP